MGGVKAGEKPGENWKKQSDSQEAPNPPGLARSFSLLSRLKQLPRYQRWRGDGPSVGALTTAEGVFIWKGAFNSTFR